MGTLAASTVIDRAIDILQDSTNVRWPKAELTRWFNDGQRVVVFYRPEASPLTTNITLESGVTKQTITGVSGAIRLLDVVRNMGVGGGSPGRSIRLVSREILDSQIPTWHSDAGAAEVKHFIFDGRDPKTFYVWPKPTSGSSIEALLSVAPAEVTELDGVVTGSISIDDTYAEVILDYILYRAYSKDADFAANAQRAIAHYNAFTAALGVRVVAEKLVNPATNTVFNPNNPVSQSGGGTGAA